MSDRSKITFIENVRKGVYPKKPTLAEEARIKNQEYREKRVAPVNEATVDLENYELRLLRLLIERLEKGS